MACVTHALRVCHTHGDAALRVGLEKMDPQRCNHTLKSGALVWLLMPAGLQRWYIKVITHLQLWQGNMSHLQPQVQHKVINDHSVFQVRVTGTLYLHMSSLSTLDVSRAFIKAGG